jgi:3-oxoacyl-[acyl-carrier protein] reductase
MKLADLKCIVTGGGSGMGRHFSLAFCRAGAKVAAFDIEEKGLEALKAEAQGLPGELRTYRVNVADEAQVSAGIDRAWTELGSLNGLVNNAGIFRDGLLVKTDRTTGKVSGKLTREQWQAVIDVDLTGPFLMTRELCARMIDGQAGPGVIVNISSVSRHGNMGQSNYSAAKAGLVADTKLWGEELARYGIRVAAIAPGFIRTPILEGMRPEMLEKMVSRVPLRRLGEPEEIFAGIRFIVECDYFTGRCLDIDGGVVL